MTETHDIDTALGLDGEPVAIAFLTEPPVGVARWSGGPVAAGCAFWRQARAGRTFYTEPADHYHCSVGAHVHGIALAEEQAAELGESVKLMTSVGYVEEAEVPSIPTVAGPAGYIAYGPVTSVPFDPDVVVVAATPGQAMLLHEAALRAGVSPMTAPTAGRPGCAVLPLAMQSGQTAISLGCAGNRISTGLRDEELYSAVPGHAWPAVVEALDTILAANAAMEAYYRDRLDRVEEGAAPAPG
ncbi:DUF169 domain-containing protein [soil metagenome]|nr:DUF169 domain-containing protein [Actinomycetota bacterium]